MIESDKILSFCTGFEVFSTLLSNSGQVNWDSLSHVLVRMVEVLSPIFASHFCAFLSAFCYLQGGAVA